MHHPSVTFLETVCVILPGPLTGNPWDTPTTFRHE